MSATRLSKWATLRQDKPLALMACSNHILKVRPVLTSDGKPGVSFADHSLKAGFVSPNGTGYQPPNQYYPQELRPELQGLTQLVTSPYGPPRVYDHQFGGIAPRMSITASQPQGMFTRNLIGSLAASAFRLTDVQDKIGIWFILQDLSVRTEGCFR